MMHHLQYLLMIRLPMLDSISYICVLDDTPPFISKESHCLMIQNIKRMSLLDDTAVQKKPGFVCSMIHLLQYFLTVLYPSAVTVAQS